MFCGACGAKNPDGAAFCQSCGAPLREMQAEAVPQGGSAADSIQSSQRNKMIGIAAVAAAAIVVVFLAVNLLGGRGYESTVTKFLDATLDGDAETIISLLPDKMVDQALGEYEERLQGAGLSVVRTLPDHPVWVMADGRRLWRVMDNLLSNCAKYALEGSRVYMEIHYDDKSATLSLKNISREALNVPVERLMERFVRGDESRSTEGSGLGLSIAQSMTELQKGTFHVDIDGDLFKAMVTLPLAPAEELASIQG